MPITFDPGNVSVSHPSPVFVAYPDDDFQPGDVAYLDPTSNGSARRAAATDEVAADAQGIAICSCKSDQRVVLAQSGTDVNLGEAVLVPGRVYFLYTSPGKICDWESLPVGAFVTIVGVAKSTSVLALCLAPSGVRKQ